MTEETKTKAKPASVALTNSVIIQKCIELAKSGTKSVIRTKTWYTLKHIVDKKIMTISFNETAKSLTVTFNHKRMMIVHDKTVDIYRRDMGWENIVDELFAKLGKKTVTKA